jgi:hypothetical protein
MRLRLPGRGPVLLFLLTLFLLRRLLLFVLFLVFLAAFVSHICSFFSDDDLNSESTRGGSSAWLQRYHNRGSGKATAADARPQFFEGVLHGFDALSGGGSPAGAEVAVQTRVGPRGAPGLASGPARPVDEFPRRTLPREEWPWRRKPRWGSREMDEIRQGANPNARTRSAVRKYGWRGRKAEREGEHQRLTVAQVAQDIGRSPTTVQRLLREGLLRRFKGGIAESSFEALLREHPDRIPYGKLPPAKRI